jgi:hypothetical protein
MEGQQAQFLEAIKELKEPYVSEKEIENARLAKERFAANERQDREYREAKQKRCPHTRPEDRKSLFMRIRNVFPRPKDGLIPYSLVCSRCFKLLQNYDLESGKFVDNAEFNFWIQQPTSTVQA